MESSVCQEGRGERCSSHSVPEILQISSVLGKERKDNRGPDSPHKQRHVLWNNAPHRFDDFQ